jgi:hypothetical protein
MRNSISRLAILGIALQAGLLLVSGPSFGQALDKQQQKCVNGLNAGGAKVNRAQNRESQRCWSQFQKGQEASAESCWLSDPRSKVMHAAQKVFDAEPKLCGSSSPPPFAYTSAVVVTMAGRQQSVLFLGDLFAGSPDVPAALGIADPNTGRCQLEAIKAGHQLEEALLKSANGAKKMYLKGNAQVPAVTDAPTLAAMVTSAVLGDPKLDKRGEKLAARIESRCGSLSGPALYDAFPSCLATSASALGACVARAARCRGCNKVAEMDELPLDCDQIDDPSLSSSCFSGPNPTTFLTPAPTLVP